MLAGAAIASGGLALDIGVGVHLSSMAALLVVASFPLLRWLPEPHEARLDVAERSAGEERSWSTRIALLCAIAFASFLTEGAAVDWSAVYLRESVGANAAIAGLSVVAFSAGMTVSRFAGDRLSTRYPPATVVRVGVSVGAAALAIALTIQGIPATIVAFAILGLGVGPVVPLAFSAGGATGRPGGRTALAIVVTAGYVGGIVGPLVIGFVADRITLRAAFVVPVLMCVVAAAAAGALGRRS